MRTRTPIRGLSLLGLVGLLLAAPLIVLGLVLGRLNGREESVRPAEYVLVPPADGKSTMEQ